MVASVQTAAYSIMARPSAFARSFGRIGAALRWLCGFPSARLFCAGEPKPRRTVRPGVGSSALPGPFSFIRKCFALSSAPATRSACETRLSLPGAGIDAGPPASSRSTPSCGAWPRLSCQIALLSRLIAAQLTLWSRPRSLGFEGSHRRGGVDDGLEVWRQKYAVLSKDSSSAFR